MYLYHSRIYAQILHIRITGKHMEYFLPYAYFLPFSESCINTLPRSITFWHFSPLGTCSCNPQHSIQHTAVIFGWAPLFACSFRRQYIFDSFPFLIADFISFHILKYITFLPFVQLLFFKQGIVKSPESSRSSGDLNCFLIHLISITMMQTNLV